MQQIAVLSHIVWQSRVNITNRLFRWFLLYALLFHMSSARGPHHPKSDVNRQAQQEQQKHINEHLGFESKHIQEDVNAQKLPTQKKVEEMTDDERNYLYFKVHDLDGNDKLDGLEMFYSATHHSASDGNHHQDHEHEHEHSERSGTDDVSEVHNSETNQQTNDSASDVSNNKLLELDENGRIINKNFNHIIDVLDNFLNLADINDDGYLNYAEYAAAVKLGNAIVEVEQNPEL